jgi:hypothetical protein
LKKTNNCRRSFWQYRTPPDVESRGSTSLRVVPGGSFRTATGSSSFATRPMCMPTRMRPVESAFNKLGGWSATGAAAAGPRLRLNSSRHKPVSEEIPTAAMMSRSFQRMWVRARQA